ncbi:serine hydroxymethyltransferase [Candidatus Gottesmanbacteria bacterium]|nr:serine hydroxymethyltransferase [Candidatus Gottesmanbacteria bacterium]
MKLKDSDPKIYDLITEEIKRQRDGLEMIPSENYVSLAVREAMGSVLTNKYSEGYPKKRYYGGNEYIDEVENLARERAKKLFGVEHVNVQPYSGSPANLAVYLATLSPGDTVMGLNLPDGGHLTHGWKVSATGQFYKSVPYHVREDGRVDMDEVWKLAREYKPKLIWAGATAFVYQYPFEKFAEIADSVKAYFAADIAHVVGLIIAKVHKSPFPYAHIVTTTTHKTLRGPRGGMIMVTQRGMEKDPELPEKVDRAVFPGLQGGPHDHQTAAIAVALKEAASPKFKYYGKQIVKNAQALAQMLVKSGLTLVGRGTENHLLLISLVPQLGPGGGIFVQEALQRAGITVNKNTIPKDPSSPFYPSGVRLGTPALTTRGMKEQEMKRIGKWVAEIVRVASIYHLPTDKESRVEYVKKAKQELMKNSQLEKLSREVKIMARKFPVP